MTGHSFTDIAPEYYRRWNQMKIVDGRERQIDGISHRLIVNKVRYGVVERKTGVPWYVIAAIHERESGADFSTYLGNGEPLNRTTRLVPRGRGPFVSWEDGAIDALQLEGLDRIKVWPIERILYSFETYNGFGPRLRGKTSGYVWSYTNQYDGGKYVADGVWDPNAVDKQAGCAAILHRMMELDASIVLPPAYSLGLSDALPPRPPVPTTPPSAPSRPTSQPAGAGAGGVVAGGAVAGAGGVIGALAAGVHWETIAAVVLGTAVVIGAAYAVHVLNKRKS